MKYGISISVSVIALALAQGPANAEATPPVSEAAGQAEAGEGGDIIVTAQRRSERLQDVPIAISAVTGESLAKRGVSNLQDFTATVPSVNIQQRRASGVVTIRGIGFEIVTAGADPGVAVHTDGIYVARPAGAIANFYDIDRIEVARGPQGTLYGRNATGGAVNLITRAPTTDASGYVNLSYGNYNAVTVEGALSGPIAEGVQARVAFRTDDHDGYGTNIATGHGINDLNTRAVRGRIRMEPTDNLVIDLSADYYHENDGNFTSHFRDVYAPTAIVLGNTTPTPQDVYIDQETINRRTFWGASASAELRVSDNITLRSLTGYRDTKYYYYTDGDGTSTYVANITLRSLTGYRDTKYYYYTDGDGTSTYVANIGRNEIGHTWSQEVQLVGDNDRLKWVIGGYYFFEHNFGDGFGSIPRLNLFNNHQQGIQETNSYAMFGQATYKIFDSLGLTIGGRYTKERKKLLFEATGTPPNIALRNDAVSGPSQASFSAFTPKVSLDYHVAPGVLLYVSAQRGFKSGGYAIGAKTPAFRPETIWSYEGGIKATWLDGALRTNISAFHYDYTDLQVGFIQGTVSVVTNAASATVNGIEAEITVRPIQHLVIEANGALLDATYKSYTTTDPQRPALGLLDLSGNHLAQAPKKSGSVAAEYEVPLPRGGLSLRGEFTFSSRAYFDAFNQKVNSGDPYGLLNAFVTYRPDGGSWDITGFIRNIENDDVAVGGIVGSRLQGGPVLISYMPPRTYGVRVGHKF